MHANNETGTVQPIEEIGKMTRSLGILFHTDAAQSVGKIPVNVQTMGVDLLSIAGHKLYAPKGIGALYIRRGVKLEKLIHGADHESNLRAGTENVLEIVGLGKAAAIARSLVLPLPELRDLLYERIRDEIPDVKLNGHLEIRLPNTLSLGFPGVDAARMLEEMNGIAASAGAACHSDSGDISGVLAAMKVPVKYALGTIRFSLGRMTTREEIVKAVPLITEAYRKLSGREPEKPAATELTGGDEIRLTEYTHSLGCACKLRPQLLERILAGFPKTSDPSVLVGQETCDDAAVYLLDTQTALVQTVDFIPPVVDDPYLFGAIAAANALSDIYAMGGRPLLALGIVGFPDRKLPLGVLQKIIKGANDKAAEAGISIVGGHSIEDGEPKFGLSVTGIVSPDRILRNSTARPGDSLVLTKPLGTGIITTAIKRGVANEAAAVKAAAVMSELNRVPAQVMAGFPVTACTDVTGFGLLGHLKEMVVGAGVTAEIETGSVPVLPEAWEYAAGGAMPGGTRNNMDYVADVVRWRETTPELMKLILADAQTSGGLLISIPAAYAESFVKQLRESGISSAAVIGSVREGAPAIIA